MYSIAIWYYLFIVKTTGELHSSERQIEVQLNPGCNISECSSENFTDNIIYARSKGRNDTLHYVWSTGGSPTLLMVKCLNTSSIVIVDWPNFIQKKNTSLTDGSIHIDGGEATCTSILMMFNSLFEYTDAAGNADITSDMNTNITLINFNELLWDTRTTFAENNYEVFIQSRSFIDKSDQFCFGSHCGISMSFKLFNHGGMLNNFPKYHYNDQYLAIDFAMSNLSTKSVNSRFSLSTSVSYPINGMLLADCLGTTNNSHCLKLMHSKSINDEYSPSAFSKTTVLWRSLHSSLFWYWKDICYLRFESLSSVQYSSNVKASPLIPANLATVTSNSFVNAFVQSMNIEKIGFNSSIISFGKQDDGFFRKTNFTNWVSMIGFDKPPSDNFSTFTVCIILFVFVLPLMIAIFIWIFLCIRCFRMRYTLFGKIKDGYQPI